MPPELEHEPAGGEALEELVAPVLETALGERAALLERHAREDWLRRRFQEPRRLFRRCLIDGVPFATQRLLMVTWRRLFAQH